MPVAKRMVCNNGGDVGAYQYCGPVANIMRSSHSIKTSLSPTYTPTPNSNNFLDMKYISSENTPSPTPSPSATSSDIMVPVVAAPNISRNGAPIHLHFNLVSSASVRLAIYNLMGELILEKSINGNIGLNDLVWNLKNRSKISVASGLYIYSILIDDGNNRSQLKGKLVVIR